MDREGSLQPDFVKTTRKDFAQILEMMQNFYRMYDYTFNRENTQAALDQFIGIKSRDLAILLS